MNIILIACWLLLYGVLALFSNSVPNWILPAAAAIVGAVVLFRALNKLP